MTSLNEAGFEAFVFDQVEENPTTRHVNLGTTFAQKHDIDFLVAVGGGSAMDCAKGINFLLTNGGRYERGYDSDPEGFEDDADAYLPNLGGCGCRCNS